MGRGPHWTDQQIAELAWLVKKETDWNEIARRLGRTVDSCKNKAAHSNLGRRRRWTSDDEARLLHLRDVEHRSWHEIDNLLGRAHGSASHKYNQLVSGAPAKPARAKAEPKPPKQHPHPHWTTEDMALADARWRELFVNVYGKHASPQQRWQVLEVIGRALDRTPSAVENRLRLYGASFGLNAASKPLTQPAEVTEAMRERAVRLAAQLRQDPVSRLLGDPPPGYSALDQARGEPAPRRIDNNRIAPQITLATGIPR
jgi:hypothetical protein